MRKETNGLPYLFVSLSFALSIYSSSARSRALLDDAAGAPSPLAGDSVEHRMNMPDASQPQQSITLIFVAGMSICFAIFILSYGVAYKVIMVTRHGERNRRYGSHLRGMTFDEQDIHGGGEEEGMSTSTGGLDASLVSSLPTVQYRSGMLKEEETKECAVCLSEYEEGEEMKVLPVCGHCFHKACISIWLDSHSTCPICRLSLRKHAEAMPAADPAFGEFSQIASGPTRGPQLAVDV